MARIHPSLPQERDEWSIRDDWLHPRGSWRWHVVVSTSPSIAMAASMGDKSIKLSAEKSVLKHQMGDTITLTESDFLRLSEAFFEEMERKFRKAGG